jgi:hypothetical protein
MLYKANEEPEITCTGSINNAEIICTVRPLPEMIKARAFGLCSGWFVCGGSTTG